MHTIRFARNYFNFLDKCLVTAQARKQPAAAGAAAVAVVSKVDTRIMQGALESFQIPSKFLIFKTNFSSAKLNNFRFYLLLLLASFLCGKYK